MDLRADVRGHESLFNDAVRTGDFGAFVATFAEDAVMTFDGVPVGPFRGRDAIRRAYASQPPTDTMTARSIEEIAPGTALVHFDWNAGGSGTMTLTWRDDRIAALRISFDT